MKFRVKIKGIAPYLFHRMDDSAFGDVTKSIRTKKQSKEKMAEQSLYKTDKGDLYTPSDQVLGAMIKAAAAFKLKGNTSYASAVSGGVIIEPEKLMHRDNAFKIDWRSAVNHNMVGNPRVMVARGRKEDWELSFTLNCIDERFTEQSLKQILEAAGSYKGIGSFRPRFGRFEVISFEEIKTNVE